MAAKKSTPKEKSANTKGKGMDAKKLTVAKKATVTKTISGKSKKANKGAPRKIVPNVIYIGHLPKHCEERELIGFLKQFGILAQLRLCRSEKTGGSKGYAFAKFQDPEVAKIVADTLNGYLLMQKRLVSHVLAPEQIHQKLFTSNTRTVYQRKLAKRDGPKSLEKMEEVSRRLLEREQKKREKLKDMGIDYDYPGYSRSKEESKKSKPQEEAEENTPAKEAENPPSTTKKRKHSIDENHKSPDASKDKAEHSQSEKKKKKKKKDKKRRKSAP